jgi:hypothetical protein
MRDPPVIKTAIAPYTRLVARVARKECTLNTVTASPLKVPRAAPTMGALSNARVELPVDIAIHAVEQLTTAKIAAVDKSKAPEMITKVPAMAIIPSGAF